MIKVMDLIQEFLNFLNHTDEAITTAYQYYHFFEEAHNKFRAKLDSDPEFKEQFFTWMVQGKFRDMKQVTKLGQIRDNEDAWDRIRKDDADAVKAAIHIVDGEKLLGIGGADGEKKIQRLVKQLRDIKEHEIASISPETLGELQSTLGQLVAMAQAVLFGGKVHVKVGKGTVRMESASEGK